MKVPFVDFISPYQELKAELDEAYARFMQSAWYALGKEVEAFEAEYAVYCGSEHCIGVANGLDAMQGAQFLFGLGRLGADGVEIAVHEFDGLEQAAGGLAEPDFREATSAKSVDETVARDRLAIEFFGDRHGKDGGLPAPGVRWERGRPASARRVSALWYCLS